MYTTIFIIISIIAFVGYLSELAAKKGILHFEISRKLFHFCAIGLTAYSVFLIDDRTVLIFAAALSVIFTFAAVKFGLFKSIHGQNRKSWGIFFFPLSFLILLIIIPKTSDWIIFLSLLILAISDSIAAIFGTLFAKKYFQLTSDRKSIIGSILFFIVTFIIILTASFQLIPAAAAPIGFTNLSVINLFLAAFTISTILTIVEAISSKGLDNLLVPVFAAFLFYIFQLDSNQILAESFFVGIFLSAIVAFASSKAKFLTANGSAATFLLAGFIFGLGGWKWSLPILAFFILSSLLSKMRKKINAGVEDYFEKTGTRDYMQVFANGGLGGILICINAIYPSETWYLLYIALLSAVCADTWATEIGTMKKTKTYNVLTFKPAEQGISGGISVFGTFGAFIGSLVIALSGALWIEFDLLQYFMIIIAAGVFGSFFDSILGATIQAQMQCGVCEKITEKEIHCGKRTDHVKGFHWMNNDFVNLLAGLGGGLFILLFIGTIN